jgi:hypothetical protein
MIGISELKRSTILKQNTIIQKIKELTDQKNEIADNDQLNEAETMNLMCFEDQYASNIANNEKSQSMVSVDNHQELLINRINFHSSELSKALQENLQKDNNEDNGDNLTQMPLSESLLFILDPLSKVPDTGLAIGMKSSIVMPVLLHLYKSGVQDDRVYADHLCKVDSKLYNNDDVITIIEKNSKLHKRKNINNEINHDENNDHNDNNDIDQERLNDAPDVGNDDDNDNQN